MKKYILVIFVILLALSLFSCSASPTAIRVGDNKVDASEYAYYLNYNRLNLDMTVSGTNIPAEEELLAQAREQAKRHIITAEIVRIKCDELGIELTKEQKEEMRDEKDALIDSFGGLSGYLDYLNENALTDRLYDKIQENNYYYSMLYDYVKGLDASNGSDQQLRQFFAENYINVKYIRFPTVNDEGEPLDEEELASVLSVAETTLEQINGGQLTFDAAMEGREGESGITLSLQDASTAEYSADAFALAENAVGGVYTYSDGYYILQRLSPDLSYFEMNREVVEIAAGDKAFNDYIAAAESTLNISENSVCKKINFSNIMDYVK